MLALTLTLSTADRTVMSFSFMPLSSQSFAAIVQSSFLWGYLMFPIAGGALVDYYGGKVVMAWGVALWSFATFLTPWAAETLSVALLAMRTLFGIGVGVALPCMNNMIARWFPKVERARAVGMAMAGYHLGLLLSPILIALAGVLGPFVIFGLSGLLCVLVWIVAISSTPARNHQISKYEVEYVLSKQDKVVETKTPAIPPFRSLLSKLPTWSLIVANAMHSLGFSVINFWMPSYFYSVFHVDHRRIIWFSAVLWAVMAFTGYFGGLWSDILIQRGTSVTLTRKIMQSIGFIGPGIALIGLSTAATPLLASAWLTLAVGLKTFSYSGFLVNLQEIAPEYSGVLLGLSDTVGTLAAIIGTIGVGFFLIGGSFQGFMLLLAFLYFLAALFYILFPIDGYSKFTLSPVEKKMKKTAARKYRKAKSLERTPYEEETNSNCSNNSRQCSNRI